MRRFMFALAGMSALSTATVANAALTIGAAGSTNGTATSFLTSPTAIEFDTTNPSTGSYSSFFQFNNDGFTAGVFSATASSVPLAGTTVSMLQLFTGGTVIGGLYSGGTLVSGVSGSSNSLTLSTNLTPNTGYTLQYSGTLAAGSIPGNISGNGAFGFAAVPEPATWGLMLLGFGGMGLVMRRRRRPALAQIA